MEDIYLSFLKRLMLPSSKTYSNPASTSCFASFRFVEFPEQNNWKILHFTKLYFGEGFAEALGTKTKGE